MRDRFPPGSPGAPIELHQPPVLQPAGPVDPLALDALSPKSLDALPFGVIGLDSSGKVFRYNRAEARLARLDQRQVLGRSFFEEVAPCTSTADFEGRFRDFVGAGLQQVVRFTYRFDFPFGAQDVEVEMAPASAPGRFYLCVNRRKFYAARVKPPAGPIAPTQAELSPDESRLGVVRDRQMQRTVAAGPGLFASLASAWEAVAPQGWSLFCTHWGAEWGKLAVVDLETEAQEELDSTLQDLLLPQAFGRVSTYLARRGWGHLEVDLADAGTDLYALTFERSALAEAVGVSEVVRCALFSGFFGLVLGHITGGSMVVREVRCAAQGHPSCAFVGVPESRRAELGAALERAEDDPSVALAALRPTRPG